MALNVQRKNGIDSVQPVLMSRLEDLRVPHRMLIYHVKKVISSVTITFLRALFENRNVSIKR